MPVERIHGLERPQGRVDLGRMTIEGIEGSLDALLLVALFGHGQVLDARQRLAPRRLWSGPGFRFH